MKKKKEKWADDYHTIAPMTGDEIPSGMRGFYLGTERRRNRVKVKSDLTRKEKRAITRALFLEMLPRYLIIIGGFAIAFLIAYLWLM